MRERQEIGRGSEHKVFTTSVTFKQERILKVPKAFNAITLHYFFGGVETPRREIRESEEMVAGKENVRVANARIFPFKKGYIMAQQRIREDHSVPDLRAHLENQGLNDLALRYVNSPSNFMSQDGTVYLIDPTKPPLIRLAGRVGGRKGENLYRKAQILVKRAFRKIKRIKQVRSN